MFGSSGWGFRTGFGKNSLETINQSKASFSKVGSEGGGGGAKIEHENLEVVVRKLEHIQQFKIFILSICVHHS